jgi:hypothetical protein
MKARGEEEDRIKITDDTVNPKRKKSADKHMK